MDMVMQVVAVQVSRYPSSFTRFTQKKIKAIASLLATNRFNVLICSGVSPDFFLEFLVEPSNEREWIAAHDDVASNANQREAMCAALLPHVQFFKMQTDVGVRQIDAIRIDYDATVDALAQFVAHFDEAADSLERRAREFKADVVLFDISSLGAQVGHRLGVPTIAITNFEWSTIYRAASHSALQPYIEHHINEYRHATYLLRLPACLEMPFEHCVRRDLGFTGRRSRVDRDVLRERIGLQANVKYLMMTFGGHAAMQFSDSDANVERNGWRALFVDASPLSDDDASTLRECDDGSVHVRLPLLRARADVLFVDVLHAADALCMKPGYGTVSEAIMHQTPAVWVSRPGFAEESRLVEQLEAHIACERVDAADVIGGTTQLFAAAERVWRAQKQRVQEHIEPDNDAAVEQIEKWLEN